MRAVTVVFAFAALATGFILLDRVTAPPGDARHGPATAESLGVAQALANRAGLAVGGIVLAPNKGEERDFRGLHSAEGRLRPVYGRARTVCTGQAVGPSCWEISYLEIDGQPVAHRVTALDTRTEPPGDDADEAIETADAGAAAAGPEDRRTPPDAAPPSTGRGAVEPPPGDWAGTPVVAETPGRDTAAVITPDRERPEAPDPTLSRPDRVATGEIPMPVARPDLAMPDAGTPGPGRIGGGIDGARAGPVHSPTHAVDRPIINVRGGPGTDMPVVARLPAGMRLSLIGRHDDWGRFVVLDGVATGREVWAALRIVKPLP